MSANAILQELLEEAAHQFNIVEEFKALNPRRKLLICEHLFLEGRAAFHGTVDMFWPEADEQDMKTLEKFLYSSKSRAN